MTERAQSEQGDGGAGADPITQRLREGILEPKGPADFRIELDGDAVRAVIVDIDPLALRSSTVKYILGHAREADMTTEDGRKAGASRAEICGSIDAPQKAGSVATFYLADSRYKTGAFFCWAADALGKRAEKFLWSPSIDSGIIDTSMPPDVTRPQLSESGIEVSPGVVASQVSASAVAPVPEGSFHQVTLYYEHYLEVGSLVQGETKVHTGEEGGSIQFQFNMTPFRRGTGTITLTPGSAAVNVVGGVLTKQARAGDYIEEQGTRALVASVTDNENLVLDAPWDGPPITQDGFKVIPLVRVYFVSVSLSGTHRSDITNAPYADVLLDATMSAPNAPLLTGQSTANGVRLLLTPVVGTDVDHHTVYRAEGAGVTWPDASYVAIFTVTQESGGYGTVVQLDDFDFTMYQREQGQVFSYVATATNIRNEQSAPSTLLEVNCRLEKPEESTTGKRTEKNFFWNGFIMGTSGGLVGTADTGQDVGMGGITPTPGHYRWGGGSSGIAKPAHQNTAEIVLPWMGLGGDSWIEQRIDAWDSATAGATAPRIDKNSYWMMSIYAYSSSATPPDGQFVMWVAEYDAAGVFVNFMKARKRLPDDTFDETDIEFVFEASDLTQNEVVRCSGCFKPNPTGTVAYILPRFIHTDTTNNNNLIVTRAMFHPGTELALWTPEMVASGIRYNPPSGGPPYRDTGEGGNRTGFHELP